MKKRDFRIFLGNPPWRKKDRLGVRAGSRWPFTMPVEHGEKVPAYVPFPFFLAYATALLERNGFHVSLVDAIALGIDEEKFLERIQDFYPDLVVIETSTPSFNQDIRITKEIKKRLPHTFLVMCGPHVSVLKSDILETYRHIDAIMVGEYEYILLEICENKTAGKSINGVKGLIYRSNDTIVINDRHPVINDLDALPWPAYRHLPMYNYNDDFQVLYKPNVQIWTSRGCPYRCIFCMWPQVMYGNHLYRVRSPEKVVDEIEWLIKTYGFKSFYIDDDTFNLGKSRLMKFCDELKKRRLGVTWGAMARADTMDEETLVTMAEAGLVGIKYGIESAVQSIVTASGKDLDLEKAKRTIAFTKKHGVKVHLTFTFGLPGETKESIEKTIAFALEQQTYSVQFSITTPFPGTVYFDNLKKKGFILSDNWDDFDGNTSAVFRTENLSALELHEALEKALRLYWSNRKKWV